MDKSWIDCPRNSTQYEEGVKKFLEFAISNAEHENLIRCPCVKCRNLCLKTPKIVSEHIFYHGFDVSYKNWFSHGEESKGSQTINDQFEGQTYRTPMDDGGNTIEMVYQNCGDEKAFENLLDDAKKPLYPGCEGFSKLSALIKLFNLKGKYGWSDNSFTELLGFLSQLLPKGNEIPLSMYEAKKTMSALGLEYEKIHACPNDCILYRKQHKDLSECPKCSASRWKRKEGAGNEYREGIPAKVMWYFPIIPRFRQLFKSPETAKNLIWHSNGRVVDGKLRHPADSAAWKTIDEKWPDFASDPRNLRLALSADGINPHSSLSSTYSCWPVLLVNYNLPPWLCMKRKFVMLSILISGPQQPGNDIDVYLAPLIEDLQLLWDQGVEVFDSHKKEYFNLRAVLMWTINDFPAYGNLSGCTVKGYNACPYCGVDTPRCRLKHSGKNCYIGHRRWLPKGHAFRSQSKAFNNSTEDREAPKPMNGEEIFELVDSFDNDLGKFVRNKIDDEDFGDLKGKKRKRGVAKKKKGDDDDRAWFKKKSIFFNLEYWKYALIRHQLDVMHIEKNICESIYGTLLNIPGKSKDGLKSRLDLVDMKIRGQLAPEEKENNRTWLPPACYNLTKKEKKVFCSALKDIKVPKGYSSNIRNLVSTKNLRLQGLKSHDCHVLMQQLMPIVIRAVLPKHVRRAIIRLCVFFNSLCSPVVDLASLDHLEKEVVVTLCMLEKCFPPSFFDIMVHLTVHLVDEVRKCGPVYLRWMYPFERFMKILKGYVRNRNNPEGCIAECYIAEEALEICSEYVEKMKTVGLPDGHVQKLFEDKPKGKGEIYQPDPKSLQQAHFYILEHMEEIDDFASEHMNHLRSTFKGRTEVWYKKEHQCHFPEWLKKKVYELIGRGEHVSDNLRWLSNGPAPHVHRYSAYDINGYHFETKERESSRLTQNSSVTCVASAMQVSTLRDSNPITGEMNFYGVIVDIWDINYNSFTIPVFKCNWVQNAGGVRLDEFGFTLVDLNRLGHKSDPFILASQAKQIFYVTDPVDNKWSVVGHMPNRGNPTQFNDDEFETVFDQRPLTLQLPEPADFVKEVVDEDRPIYIRDGTEGIWVDN